MPDTYSIPKDVTDLVDEVLEAARRRRLRLAVAESCTGGLLGAAMTDVSGSADCFDRGYITYSNRSKEEMLGVRGELLIDHGAVSQPVACAMAEGAVAASHAHVAVSITGIAGPGGGTESKPVGLVYFGSARQGADTRCREERYGDIGREGVRTESLRTALHMMLERVLEVPAPEVDEA